MSRRGESFSRDMPLIPATGGDSGGESGGFPFVHASSTSAEESRQPERKRIQEVLSRGTIVLNN